MACGAILRSMLLTVAGEATAHVVIDHFFGDSSVRHIAVANAASDAGLIMGRMLEPDVRGRFKEVNALPRNFNFPVRVIDHLFDFRFIAAQFGVAQHAFGNRGDTGRGARVCADVAIDAIQTHLAMSVMRKSDWLLCVRHSFSK